MVQVWRPSRLSRAQLEERRLYVQQLLQDPEVTDRVIAETVGVAESTVRTWKQRLRERGSLEATRATGPRRRLTAEQLKQLQALLEAGSKAAGYKDERWTTSRVREVIGVQFEVWYHVDHVRKVLHQLGCPPQKPDPRAMERDEQAVQTWVQTVRPELEKKVAQGATLVFVDESGFSLKPTVTRTWAPRGQTPIIHAKAGWDKLSTLGAVTTRGQFLQHTIPGAVRGPQVLAFFEHLLRHIKGDLIVVLDNARIHHTKALRAFVEQQQRLTIQYLPPYAPELNPIEHLWAYVKGHLLGNFCPKDQGELKDRLNFAWRRLRASQLPAKLTHAYCSSQT
ncbi:IS630 family transposase [Deinococcus hopiensis]|uniref:Transposase n=1 Tax=Deinococcus hopiensis KR-140 TaxID=695939 RepID=A0A1W1VVR6_9DEIO|nr:IS630 family transposase [Deinococcus hopiensis]SMB97475.1 Transposase [Deinococcus hopiensis KR-140]